MYNTYNITPTTLNYKTYQDLAFDIKSNLYKISTNIDLIVGIPRSGMIPAYILGSILSKPVCSLNEFLLEDFDVIKTTYRISLINTIKNVLIVDDSILTGRAFTNTKNIINKQGLNIKYKIKTLAVYYENDNYKEIVDEVLVKLVTPRLFQWNYLNHIFLKDAALDIDGVLCKDPLLYENDDGKNYINFLLNAELIFKPKHKIPYLITSRLIKYERETKEWLAKNNILYDHLIMLKGYTAEERRKLNLHAKFKAEQYIKLKDIQLFIESDRVQAKEIARLSNKLCFCSTTDELFGKKS